MRSEIKTGSRRRRYFSFVGTLLLSFLSLSGCLDQKGLYGDGAKKGGSATGDFAGCLETTAVNTSRIDVTYEWPSGASNISVLRNGVTVYSSVSGTGGTYQDNNLSEGYTYTYLCAASFPTSSGAVVVKNGTNVFNETTVTINAPTFAGISSISPQGTSSMRLQWPPAAGVPTAKYIALAKLGSQPNSQDFDASSPATQTLMTANKIKRFELQGAGQSQTVLAGLGDGLNYYFAVQACSASGTCSIGDGVSDYLSQSLSDDGAPKTVGASFARILNSQVVLTTPWDASLGEVSVRRVYRSLTGGTSIGSYTNVQNFTVSDSANVATELTLSGGISESTTYYYIVRDEDALGQLSQNTQIQSVNTGDLTAPRGFLGIRPAIELGSLVQGEVLVKWSWDTGAVGFDLADYKGFLIYTVDTSNDALSQVGDCACTSNNCVANPKTECSITPLDPYRTYRFHVRAYDHSGNITTNLNPAFSFADKRVIDTTAPSFASGLQSGYASGVTLSWAAASDNQYVSEPGAAISYQIWRKTSSTFATPTTPSGDGTLLATQSTRTYVDATVLEGNTYYYAVCALDSSNNRRCDGNVESRAISDVTAPTISIADNKTGTSKVWNLTFTLGDNFTAPGSLSVVVRRKVATTNNDFPTLGDPLLTSGTGMMALNSQGSPAISGTTDVSRYVNYLVVVTDSESNVGQATHSVLLDNLKPANPTLVSFSPWPSLGSTAPTVIGSVGTDASTVALYLTADCSGASGASGTRAQFIGAGLVVTLPSSNTNNIYALATSPAATTGNCVNLGNYDNIAPTLASVTINGAANRGVANLSWSLSYGAYSSSDMTHYCIRQNSTNVAGCTWTAGTSLPSTFTVAEVEGTNYLAVWIRDPGLNVSSFAKSNDIIVDATRPSWSASVTSPAWTTSTSSLGQVSVSNLSATDAFGVDKFEWAIGTTTAVANVCAATCSNMKAWTTLSTTTFTPTGVTAMTHNTTYYVNVRVLDLSGNYTLQSAIFQTDFFEPENPSFLTPAQGQNITIAAGSKTNFTGTCEVGATLVTTSGSGVSIVGSPTCSGGGTFTIETYLTGLNFSGSLAREVTVKSTKPSGLQSSPITRLINATGSCPPGYVGVAGNATYGTTDFCVSKFEMKAVTANPVGQTAESRTLNNSGNGNVSYGSANCNATNMATCFADARSDGTPWVNISQRDAAIQCDRLNTSIGGTGGTGPYQLITNAQWQTVSTAIEATANNWRGTSPSAGNSIGTSPAPGTNQINRGNSDNGVDANAQNNGLRHSSTNALASKTTSGLYASGTSFDWTFSTPLEEFEAGYRGTGQNGASTPTNGWEQRRTHFLPSGEVIWDIAGNVWEWVRFTQNWCGSSTCLDSGLAGNDASTFNSRLLPQQGNEGSSDWQEISLTTAGTKTVLEPWPSTTNAKRMEWFFPGASYASAPSAYNLGRIYIVNNGAQNTYAVRRGGYWGENDNGGVFSANLNTGPTGTNTYVGFRCAFSP